MGTPMVNGLTLFENPEFGKVRVVMRDGAPWFVAKDVCVCLGIENSRDAVENLDDDEKITVANPDGNPRAGIPLQFTIVSEAGLYSLILRSRKPEAKLFKRWVTHEVLPSIRKTGSYTVAKSLPETYIEALEALLESEKAKLAAQRELSVERNAHAVTAEQRDYYKRTKAEIGTKREASAMGTTSAAVKRADKYKTSACELAEDNEAKQRTIDDLNDRIGEGETWRTTKAIGWLLSVFAESKGMWSVVGRKLVAIGNEMGIPPQEIQHQGYGAVKKHHVAVIAEFKSRLANDPSLLAKYRKSG